MMISNLFFLIIALLVITLAPSPENPPSEQFLVGSPLNAFLISLIAFITLLGVITLQNILWRRWKRLATLVQIELILFLILYHFVLGAQRIFTELPFLFDTQGIVVLFSLILYLCGLGWYHYNSFGATNLHTRNTFATPCQYALMQLRLLLPFTLPFVFLTFLSDLLKLYPSTEWNGKSLFFLFAGSIGVMVIILVFFPPLMQRLWHCKPLPPSELKTRLDELCTKAHFKHGGLKTWTVMNHSLTAAILGLIAPFRYVIFTERLLRELPSGAIEAILAHEIGHQQRRHLYFYPLLILGMMVTAGLFSLFFSEALTTFLKIQNIRYPSTLWNLLVPLALLIPYVVVIGLYFRIVFGHFSRLFERQADLHVFRLNISPFELINALDIIATSSGNTHDMPCWHHYSIQQRMDTLTLASEDRRIIEAHDKKVRRQATLFLLLLLMGTLFLIAPLFPKTYPFKTMNRFTQSVSQDISLFFNPTQP